VVEFIENAKREYLRDVSDFLLKKAKEISKKTGKDINHVLILLIRLHNELVEGIVCEVNK